MKKIIFVISALVIFSCKTPQNIAAYKNSDNDLVGIATKKSFQQEPYASEWFNDYYAYYETDKDVVEKLKPLLKNITIIGFVGTWCDDSRREVPNFYKTLDEAEFNYNNLKLITIDKDKKAKGLEKGYHIQRVPTFIFYKNGNEIGRFVEHTVNGNSIEGDFLKILSGKPYKHPYQK